MQVDHWLPYTAYSQCGTVTISSRLQPPTIFRDLGRGTPVWPTTTATLCKVKRCYGTRRREAKCLPDPVGALVLGMSFDNHHPGQLN